MKIQCPECESSYRIDPSRLKPGVARFKARCSRCNTVFSVTLPTAEPPMQESVGIQPAKEPVSAVPPPTVRAPDPGCGGKRVLVVDDSKFFRELIVDVLKPLELEFQLAGDGVESLDILRRSPFDLVLLDLNLPRMNGYELIAAIRSDAALKHTPLLAMSGVFRKETDVARVVQAGADDFINKSFKPEQLQERVRKLLKGR